MTAHTLGINLNVLASVIADAEGCPGDGQDFMEMASQATTVAGGYDRLFDDDGHPIPEVKEGIIAVWLGGDADPEDVEMIQHVAGFAMLDLASQRLEVVRTPTL